MFQLLFHAVNLSLCFESILSFNARTTFFPKRNSYHLDRPTQSYSQSSSHLITIEPESIMPESSILSDVNATEERLISLMMNSAQPQEGTLGREDGTNVASYGDVRDLFSTNDVSKNVMATEECPQDGSLKELTTPMHLNFNTPAEFRDAVRAGKFRGPTNGVCPGFMQCNLVVLEEGPAAFDFLLFCQRNKKACPLIEVCDVGSPFADAVAAGSDLRTDIPKYCIYRNGKLESEVEDVTPYWPEKSVAFLIGCSFSYDGALTEAGIRLRSVEQNKNVPMYKTDIPCRPSGNLHGNVVVSMKPIKALHVAKEVEITSKFPQAHGGPLCVGCPEAIGILDLNKPDWGDRVDVLPGEVPVFHACGVTPQQVLMESGVPFAITHSPGHMFVTDLPSETII
mmetsp:Transcript_8212/g.17492  ORF Transcript_8212/g.17492 Transcript_8212/m.17492 type:complete len:397 (-) Transcript_8212:156-1346(-)